MRTFEEMLREDDVCAICGAPRKEWGQGDRGRDDLESDHWVCLKCRSHNRSENPDA